MFSEIHRRAIRWWCLCSVAATISLAQDQYYGEIWSLAIPIDDAGVAERVIDVIQVAPASSPRNQT